MLKNKAVLLLMTLLVSTNGMPLASCPHGWLSYKHTWCLLAVNEPATWDEANAHCVELGAQMFVSTSHTLVDEMDDIGQLLKLSQGNFFIGGKVDAAGNWISLIGQITNKAESDTKTLTNNVIKQKFICQLVKTQSAVAAAAPKSCQPASAVIEILHDKPPQHSETVNIQSDALSHLKTDDKYVVLEEQHHIPIVEPVRYVETPIHHAIELHKEVEALQHEPHEHVIAAEEDLKDTKESEHHLIEHLHKEIQHDEASNKYADVFEKLIPHKVHESLSNEHIAENKVSIENHHKEVEAELHHLAPEVAETLKEAKESAHKEHLVEQLHKEIVREEFANKHDVLEAHKEQTEKAALHHLAAPEAVHETLKDAAKESTHNEYLVEQLHKDIVREEAANKHDVLKLIPHKEHEAVLQYNEPTSEHIAENKHVDVLEQLIPHKAHSAALVKEEPQKVHGSLSNEHIVANKVSIENHKEVEAAVHHLAAPEVVHETLKDAKESAHLAEQSHKEIVREKESEVLNKHDPIPEKVHGSLAALVKEEAKESGQHVHSNEEHKPFEALVKARLADTHAPLAEEHKLVKDEHSQHVESHSISHPGN